jgi:hypothetical protein
MSMAFMATKINMKTSMNMMKNTYKHHDRTKMTTVSTSLTQTEKLIPNFPLVSMIVIGSRFLYLDNCSRGLVVGCLLTCRMVVVMGIEIPGTAGIYTGFYYAIKGHSAAGQGGSP